MKMSQNTKETLQMIVMVVFGTLVIGYQNRDVFRNMFSDKDDKEKTEKTIQIKDSANKAQNDSIVQYTLNNAKQLKR